MSQQYNKGLKRKARDRYVKRVRSRKKVAAPPPPPAAPDSPPAAS